MAAHEISKDSTSTSTTNKVNIIADIKTEKTSIVSPSNDQHDGSKETEATERKDSTLDVIDNSTDIQKNDSDDTKDESKDDLKSMLTDKQDDSKTNEKQETQNAEQNVDEEKEVKSEDNKDSPTRETAKRKRKIVSNSTADSPVEESSTRSKRKKLKTNYDRFCWRCHKEKVDAFCTACPRSWHRKCIGGMPSSLEQWICGECASILKAENAETRSTAMAQLSIDQLCMLLKYVVERLRDHPGSEPFCKPVDLTEISNYLDYVIKPMDLSLLELNVRSKLYGSTDAFMADAKWIQHNCIVFNTCGGVYADTSKLTNAAKQIIKLARQEVSEIEACPDCYAHSRNLPRPQPTWFIEPCRRPHTLVWAKLKGFPFWPAKAMPRVNSQGYVDVRFFGEHDRAWVSPKDLFLYSEEPPAPSPRKRKNDMDECMQEITRHCRKLTLMFGQFKFAPPKVQYDPNNPMQIQLMLPNYNPLEPNNPLPNLEVSTPQKKKASQKKRSFVKDKPQNDELPDNGNDSDSKGDAREKENEIISTKVQKLDTNVNNNKSDEKKHRENVKSHQIVQDKMMKDEKSGNTKISTSRSHTDNLTVNNNTSANNTDKNAQKAKNDTKSFTKNLSRATTQSITESSDTSRAPRRSFLRNILNPELALSQIDNSKTVTKNTRYSKVFKPKTRIVDKLNAEKELKIVSMSKENEKLLNSNKVTGEISLLKDNKDNKESPSVQKNTSEITLSPNSNIAYSASLTKPVVSTTDKSVLLLVVNGKTVESAKQVASTIDCQSNMSSTNSVHNLPKRENKARKTFPNKSHSLPNVRSSDAEVIEFSADKETYQLVPPEAGPISARLHQDAHDLARRMGQMMEEAYKAAAQDNVNGENGTAENYQATTFFLRMQIEHLKWQHQQHLAELKHNADRTMREMRASMEAEKLRSIGKIRKEIEKEKNRCIEETKRKQWCAKCGREAMFYCCWNTAYCNYPCQQSHWPIHMLTCSQNSTNTHVISAYANVNSKPQQSNNVTHDSASKTYSLSPGKLSGIPPSSASSFRNKTSQDKH